MNTTATLHQMQQLKLMGMAASYHSQLELPLHQQLESHELLAHLVGAETLHRTNEKTATYVKAARLRLSATVEQVECSPARVYTPMKLTMSGRSKLTTYFGGEEVMFMYDSVVNNFS